MTPETKNTLIQVLNTAISVNTVLKVTCSVDRVEELEDRRTKLDNAINWVKEQ